LEQKSSAPADHDAEHCWDSRRAMANGVKFGRKPKLIAHQRAEAIRRRAGGEMLRDLGFARAKS
jgi:hypothetical protein